MEVINLNLRDQRYFAMNNLGRNSLEGLARTKMHVQKDEGVKLYNSCKNSIFVRENLLLSCLFLVLILSPTLFGFTKPPQILYMFKKRQKKKKNETATKTRGLSASASLRQCNEHFS